MGPFPLRGSPELATRINNFDWANTGLGPLQQWPASLRIALNILLGSGFPMQLLWGNSYIHFYNDAYIPIAGDKHPLALGQAGAAIWPEVWEQVLPMLEQVRRSGEPSWAEDLLLVLNRRGFLEEGYFTFSYGPVRSDIGSIDGIFIAVTETTQRVIAARRLRTAHDLSLALGGLADEAAIFATAQAILEQNPSDLPFVQVYMFDSFQQKLQLSGSTGLAPDHPAMLPEIILSEADCSWPWPMRELRTSNGPQQLSVPDCHSASFPGGPWDVPANSALILPLRLEAGAAPAGYLIAGISPRLQLDVDYREFLERIAAQLATALAGARAQNSTNEAIRIRDDFLSIAAHELKNPLTPVIGKLQLLQRRLEREGVAQRHLNDLAAVTAETHRLVAMIDALLDVSQLRSGQLRIERSRLDLRTVIGAIVNEVEIMLSQHTLHCSLPDQPVLVEGDAMRLTQVMRNLISNAIKYSPDGGTIRVMLSTNETIALLTVQDQGIGIAPDVLPRIFQRYYRAEDEASASIGGLGVGLFVVHEVVRLHGGTVSVESALKQGSRFTISLPIVLPQPAPFA